MGSEQIRSTNVESGKYAYWQSLCPDGRECFRENKQTLQNPNNDSMIWDKFIRRYSQNVLIRCSRTSVDRRVTK
jgi:hypothetical protein